MMGSDKNIFIFHISIGLLGIYNFCKNVTTDSVEYTGPLGSMTRRNAVEQKKVKGSERRRQQELIVSCLLLDSLMAGRHLY